MTAFLYDALRTPRGKGKNGGGLASLRPEELVAGLVDRLRERTTSTLSPDVLILGSVGQVGAQGGNIALVSKLKAELPDQTAAFSLNNYCASGLTAVGQAAAMVSSGAGQVVLAGGVEMMSRVPFMGDAADYYKDSSLPRHNRYLPVALAADRLAEDLNVSRAELDAVALTSQQRAVAADGGELTASRVPMGGLERDECIRATTADALFALAPAFAGLAPEYREVIGRQLDHRHTIGHAPPIADGAALVLVGGEKSVDAKPRARVVAWAESGGNTAASLTAGLAAMERVLEQASLSLAEMDRIEFMESFSVTMVKFMRDWRPDMEKVNVGGGHIARGHPLGASGAILLSTTLDALDSIQGRFGLTVVTGASGIGSAMIIERLEA